MTPSERHRRLVEAETKASQLFQEVRSAGFIRPGMTEKHLNDAVYQTALERFGVRQYWHKRIVRAGANTISPYRENPPNLVIQADDILFFDFGPVFEEFEADFGRTYVLGNDSEKLRLRDSIESAWHVARDHFVSRLDITGAELFEFVIGLASTGGWDYPQEHCGHLVGNFPHEQLQGDELDNYIHPQNTRPLRDPDRSGNPRDWILEIHFVDRRRQFGGFFEQLLT